MSHDRITQLRIRGMRVIDDVTLDLKGLTVLIGDNGSGKSTLLEALELLRQVPQHPPNFYLHKIVMQAHGGPSSLLRRGAGELKLGVTVEGAGPRLRYDFAIGADSTQGPIVSESLVVHDDSNTVEPLDILARTDSKTRVLEAAGQPLKDVPISTMDLAVTSGYLGNSSAVHRMLKALRKIEQHVSFETRPLWQQRELQIQVGPRRRALVEHSIALERHGLNLPNCYQQLRNLGNDVWTRVLERARMGLGADLRDFLISVPERGNIALDVDFGRAGTIAAECLSEGQISYLAFIALVELNQERSLLAFDEPEVHLHPALLARVAWMLEEVAESCPVIVATHSDRFLDALADPASSVVLCGELDEQRAMRIRRPNAARLSEWLESYRGLGAIRSEGYEAHVFDDESSEGSPVEGNG